jgi:1-acyl-sn-glycerol-3-phosphate acyltransferase
MQKTSAAYCRELAARLHSTLGVPKDDGRALASLLVNGGSATLSDVAAITGATLGRAESSCESLARRGAVWQEAGLKPGTWTHRQDAGVRGSLARLRHAYMQGGLAAVRDEHARTAERSSAYRRMGSLIEGICPVRDLFRLCAELDDALAGASLPTASAAVLSRLPDRWEIPVADGARELLRDRPLVIYGNHPSMLTPFLVAAAVERDDLKILAHRYVTTLVPGMTEYVLPLEPTHLVSSRRRGIASPAHAVSLSALRRLDQAKDLVEARRANRAALEEGVQHVLAGGALAIFPDGGRDGGPWYPGLGRLIAALRDSDALLVPVHEGGSSNRRLYRALRRRRRSAGRSSPIRFTMGEPLSILRLSLPADVEPLEIARLLESLYRAARWTAIDRNASLRSSPLLGERAQRARSRLPRSAILLPDRC